MSEQYELNKNLAQMLRGGVIMDVTTPEQAKRAEAAFHPELTEDRTVHQYFLDMISGK